MGSVASAFGDLAGPITKAIGGFGGAAAGAPQINAPSFKGVNTPSFSLSPQGTLSRSDSLVPDTEASLLGFAGANRLGLQAAGQGQLAGIDTLRKRIDPLFQRTAGFFDKSAGLQGQLQNQFNQLTPGFGRLTESRVAGVRGAASKAVGNLRSGFGKRNLAGASFANQQIAQVQATFAEEEDKVRAESFIQEQQAQEQIVRDIGGLLRLDQATLQQEASVMGLQLGLNQAQTQVFANNLAAIQSENSVLQGRIGRELQEFGISGNIITQIQSIASQVAIAQAKLQAENAKQAGAGFLAGGDAFGDILKIGAPLLATAFGGPAAGIATSALVGSTGGGLGFT